MSPALEGKRALITGAASGLGLAIARLFKEQGASLFLVDRDEEGLAAVASEIEGHYLRVELHGAAHCAEIVGGAVDALGGLDVLVNNAGIMRFGRSEEETPETWDRVLAVNLSAPFHLCRLAIPHLLESRGNIINIASSGGIVGTAYAAAYSSAKAGLIHMTKCLAVEFAKAPIRINAVAPGGMETNIMRGASVPDALDPQLLSRFMGLRPPVDPREVAELVAFVASDRASAIHGGCLSADGGISAGYGP
jgi:NAD(P)-dependent dehydrogenase (short-subunit alcohol dehydrogenase family)